MLRLGILLHLFVLLPLTAHPLVEAAKKQIGVTTSYDGSYVTLDYPGGDVPMETGVCTDVLVRAARTAYQVDLQKAVHLDMVANFSKYPKIWGLRRPDRNIDHRRVPNLQTFLKRKHKSLPVTQNAEDYLPGDIVTCMVNGNLPHVMIVSDEKTTDGQPYIIHNVGGGVREQKALFLWPLTGHYRWVEAG